MYRRDLLKTATTALSGVALLRARTEPVTYAYVGCYTTEARHGRGDGIHVYRVHPVTGLWTPVQQVPGLINPSFLTTHPNQRFLYSVHGDQHYVTAFRIDPATGQLSPLNQAETGGVNGVCLALCPDARFLAVANYGSGTVAVLPVRASGELESQTQLLTLEGKPGPHRVEQAASHPHQVVFDPSGRFVLVPDKGLDRVFVFRFDPATGRLTPTAQGSLQTRAAAGPRHLAFHPTLPVVWILNELSSAVTTCAWHPETGALEARQILPSLPAGFTGESTGAEIAVAPGGRFVYCSNRGHDSIAAYAVNPRTGLLTPAGWTSSGGKIPRFIGFDPSGRFLCAANEQGDSVTTFRLDSASGKLTPLGAPVPNPSAVSISFARL